MNPECRTQLPDTFLYENFPQNYMNGEYKRKRTEVLWQRELGMMDNTMPFVESRKVLDSLENNLQDLKNQERELKRKIEQQKLLVNQQKTLYHRLETGKEQIKKEKKNFIRKCTNGDCRGFLNAQYKCELCDTVVCSKCFEPKHENHICNEDLVKTAELLRKDTKACPNCAEMIFKISGCDQMYCVTCHTAFSWKTGNIVTGVVHNPHYFEYRRQNGGLNRQPGDIPCGGIPTPNEIRLRLNELHNTEIISIENMNIYKNELTRYLQFTRHYREYEIPSYERIINRDPESLNRKKRMEYLMNKKSEKIVKSEIYKEDRNLIKTRESLHIYLTMTTLLEDQLQKLMHEETKTDKQITDIIEECRHIINYVNSCFQKQANIYKYKTPKIIIPDQLLNKYNRINTIRTDMKGHIPNKLVVKI
jgi:hypothetical protein